METASWATLLNTYLIFNTQFYTKLCTWSFPHWQCAHMKARVLSEQLRDRECVQRCQKENASLISPGMLVGGRGWGSTWSARYGLVTLTKISSSSILRAAAWNPTRICSISSRLWKASTTFAVWILTTFNGHNESPTHDANLNSQKLPGIIMVSWAKLPRSFKEDLM